MDDAGLHPGLREDGFDRFGEPLQAVDAGDQHIGHTSAVQVVEHREPELRAFAVLPPDPERFAVALDGDPDGQVAGPAADRAVLADLDHQGVEVDDRVDRFQRPGAPGLDVLEHRVGDPADGVAADLDAIQARQMSGNIPDRHPAGVEVKHPLVEAGQTGLALGHELRLELPCRSRGVLTSTGPSSVPTVLGVEPLRTLPAPPGGASPGG